MKPTRSIVPLLFALALLVGSTVVAEEKAKKEKKPLADQFTADLVTVTGPTSRGLGDPVTIWIDAYTSDEVAASLKKTLADKGQLGLRDAMQDLSAGRLRIGTNTSYRLAVARQRIGSDGRVILLATNTPMTNQQIDAGMRSQDYPVSFIELKLKADGTGEGTVVGLAKVAFDDKNNLTVSSLTTQNSSLTNVQAVTKKK